MLKPRPPLLSPALLAVILSPSTVILSEVPCNASPQGTQSKDLHSPSRSPGIPRSSTSNAPTRSLFSALLALATSLATAQTSSPHIERVPHPPALKPLRLSSPSRLSITPGSTKDQASDYVSQWPGVYFQANFRGTTLFFNVGPANEVLHLVIDKQPALILTTPQPGTYRVAGLADSTHTVTLLIASESQSAPNHFGGFAIPIDQQELAPPARRPRQIEFIGDSQTVGYGNASPKHQCTPEELLAATDNTQAPGALTAAHFHADYQANAISGRGIVRNYNGFAADTLPTSYPFLLFDKKQPYSGPAWKPQWIVISLGTNDFSTPLQPGEPWASRDQLHADYEAAYVRFLTALRAKYPNAFLLLWAADLASGEIAAENQRVVDRIKAKGERNIGFILIEHLAATGCDEHPSLADDQAIATKLSQFIESRPAVWKSR